MVEMKTLTIDGTTYEIVDEAARNQYSYGTTDLEAGVSPLATGRLYFVYEATTITFTIAHNDEGTATYQAEEGMTWGGWVTSAYNTYGYTVSSNNTIEDSAYDYAIYDPDADDSAVLTTDVIRSGVEYNCW